MSLQLRHCGEVLRHLLIFVFVKVKVVFVGCIVVDLALQSGQAAASVPVLRDSATIVAVRQHLVNGLEWDDFVVYYEVLHLVSTDVEVRQCEVIPDVPA